MFQVRSSVSVPKPRTKAIANILQIVTFVAVEKEMEHKGEQR